VLRFWWSGRGLQEWSMAEDRADAGFREDEKDRCLPLEGGLAELMDVLARLLHSETDETAALDRLVCTAVELIPGVQEASIVLVVNRQKIEARAFSGDLARRMDALQEQVGQGPCLDSLYEHKTVRVPDMASENRWPRFSRGALALGASSMLCFQLFTDGKNAGTFNLYSRQPSAFDDESRRAGMLVAAHAAVVFAGTRKIGQMREALASRDVIGQAKGILMERHKVTAAEAFALLAQASSHSNIKLVNVAENLVGTGNFPSPEPSLVSG
jgi:putative methionine-R-sulfoxide reductase with GAF domain